MREEFSSVHASTALLISSDPSVVETCQKIVDAIANLRLLVTQQLAEVDRYVHTEEIALVVTHLVHRTQTAEVVSLLRSLASMQRPVATLVVMEEHYAEQALTLLRHGVADCLSRPLDLNRLAYLMDSLTLRTRYAGFRSSPAPETPATWSSRDPLFVVSSAAMGRLLEQVEVVAPQETTILLGGETGTGKTRLARMIHDLSPRRNRPFLVVNCGALADNLIESEMFGHVKGAFTGAERDRTGKFAEVGSGTLLLDEIDALPLPLQAKLLRAVEERVFEPVGSNQSQPVQARLIACSNRLLEKDVEAGRFRSDLYYRLNVVAFHLPPLRERRNAVRHMAGKFIAEFAARNHRSVQGISPAALQALEAYDWPGNIRELRNVIERAVALCPHSEIQVDDLPAAIAAARTDPRFLSPNGVKEAGSPVCSSSLGHARWTAEAARITEVLRKHGNNRLRAAEELGISRMTLYNKLHKYGLIGLNAS
jgi:two-component system response regulator HydG